MSANNVGWWPLNSDTLDYSGNGNNGVPTNLMYNSVLSYTSFGMLNSTFSSFMNRMTNQISNDGFNVVITNATLNVFQNSPFTISANYTALAVVNSTRGLFTFPLESTTSVSLNGTQSLYGLEAGDPFTIKPQPNLPKAVLVGNVLAMSSNTGANFNGGSSYMTLPNMASAVVGLSQLTVSVWVKPSVAFGGRTEFLTDCANEFFLAADANGNQEGDMCVNTGGAWYCYATTTTTINPNNWYMVTGVFNGVASTLNIYLNGQLGNGVTVTGTITNGGGSVTLGEPQCDSNWFSGSMADAQIYNTALSPTQVANLYNEGMGGSPILPANNIGWWPLNGNANDYSGNNNNGAPTSITYTNMFSYGTAYYASGTPSCASILAQYKNANFILVTPSAASITSDMCGMGGLVTYTPPSPLPTGPYLVYSSSSNVVNVIKAGTSLLLSDRSVGLLNISNLQSAIQNGYSFASPYVPSYLDWAQDSLTKRSTNGMFSFNLLNRQIASFNGASSYIDTGSSVSPTTAITVTLWMNSAGGVQQNLVTEGPSGTAWSFRFWNILAEYMFRVSLNGESPACGYTPPALLTLNTWHHVGFSYDSSTGIVRIYLDGVNVQTCTGFSGNLNTGSDLWIGKGSNYAYFNGFISDVQIYNTALTPSQMSQLYQEGIDPIPISNAGLIGWWPLNGDFNDYSGQNNNGIAASVPFNRLNDYQADPIWGGSLYNNNALNSNALNLTEGVLNCGTLAQCYSTNLEHLYLANLSLTGTYSSASTEAASLGLANSIMPP